MQIQRELALLLLPRFVMTDNISVILFTVILTLMTIILSYRCSLAVVAVPPRTQGQCLFSQEWEDVWVEPKQGAKVGTMDISTEYLCCIIYSRVGRA